MKPQIINHYNKPLAKCLSILNLLWPQPLPSAQPSPSAITEKQSSSERKNFNLSNKIKRLLVPVGPAGVSLAALLSALNSRINNRILFGFGLIGVLAPVAGSCFVWFDKKAISTGWVSVYYTNYFYLLLVLAPFLKSVLEIIGVFFLFPKGVKRSLLLSLPLGFTLGKIIWLCTVQNNDQFHTVEPWQISAVGVALGLCLLISADFFTWRKFHREDAFDARLKGIVQVNDHLDNEKLGAMIRNAIRQEKEFQKEF